MNKLSLDKFFKDVLQNDEAAMRARAICSEHCIFDTTSLLEFSGSDLEKLFPIGISKKLTPYLKN